MDLERRNFPSSVILGYAPCLQAIDERTGSRMGNQSLA